MFGSLAASMFLLAQAAAPVADPAVSPYAQYMQLLPLVPAVLVFYFLLIRPGNLQEKQRRAMLGQLKKNDKVLTAAGLYGTVVSIDPEADKVVLRISEDGNVRAVFARSGIAKVLAESTEKK